MRTSARWLILGLLVASPSHAYFLDQGRRFDFRLRAYSQVGIMTDSSEKDWPGNGPNTCVVNGKESNNKCRYSAGDLGQHRNFYYPEFDYKKGPLFLRAGRQSISWGESDDIVFMDRLNAFDLTLGAPGLYQDLDEARIPFWALRATYKVLDNWKAFSSVFGDAFVVPGVIDTTVPIDPIVGGVSPFNPYVKDPQLTANKLIRDNGFDPRTFQGLHLVVVSRQPANSWANTRWGVRLTGVVARDYTVQGWFAREFPVVPTPLLTGGPGGLDEGVKGTGPFKPIPITLIDHRGVRTP